MSYKKFEDLVSVKPVGVTMPVLESIPDAEGLLSFAARVSNPSNQHNFETADKLLAYCAKHQHWSVFDLCNLVLEVKVPRDISRQMIRHSSLRFQEFCISGDSLVTMGDGKRIPIANLYKRYQSKQYWGISKNTVRVFNEGTQTLIETKIKEVFNTGIKPVFELQLSNGRSIKATQEHKFLTRQGFKELGELSIGDVVACNGVPVYQNYEWLAEAKCESLTRNGIQYIADKAGVSYHTIRKWLRVHGLGFTHKEVSMYTNIWNKGLPTECQPRFGKFHNIDTRELMRESSRKGSHSNLYVNGNFSDAGKGSWRKKVGLYCEGYRTELLHKQGFKCAISGEVISYDTCEIDHIEPVCLAPELAFDVKNLQLLSVKEHQIKTTRERGFVRKAVRWGVVESIKCVGEEQTYDLEVEHSSHNYVANGIITHNSGRYAEYSKDMFCLRDCRMQDTVNRQNSIKCEDTDILQDWDTLQEHILNESLTAYQKAINLGIAKEVARVLLPEGLVMSTMYINGTARNWLHYLGVRTERGVTQEEHCVAADLIKVEFLKHFPSLTKQLETT